MMLQFRHIKNIDEAAPTIECPNPECKDRLWLTRVKFFYQHCPTCGEVVRRSYIINEGRCIDRVKYFTADSLA